MNQILYRSGYKYQLAENYVISIGIKPTNFIFTEYVRLDTDGALSIKEGYAWDGPSGPAFDTKNFMRGSLVHDALYQLLREGHLPQEARKTADQELRRICREDGMSAIRAWWVYQGVRIGAGPAAARQERPALAAP